MNLFAKAKKARENKKGFTLVELIVVLVILAILAAILVPALLGWIDKAKEKQYVLDARNIYIAAQAIVDEQYAKDGTALTTINAADASKLADTECDGPITITGFAAREGTTNAAAEIATMRIEGLGEDDVTATLNGGGATSDNSGWVITP